MGGRKLFQFTYIKDTILNYFSEYTQKRTLYLFAFSLLTGTVSILVNFYAIYFCVIVIIVYGLILVYIQNNLFIQLTIATKNSCYFLGFLFTLIALFIVFQTNQNSELTNIFRNIGIAILTTVAGLIMRQVLFTLDPSQEEQAEIIRDLSEELRDNTESYRIAGKRLFKIIDDFLSVKEKLLEREEEINEQYISSLSKGINIFARIEEEFPEKIDGVLEAVSTSLSSFSENTQNLLNELSRLYSSDVKVIAEKIENMPHILEKFESNMNKVFTSFNNMSNSLVKQTNEFDQVLHPRLRQLSTELDAIDTLVNDLIKAMRINLKRLAK